jgi:hypothetical protein
VIYLDTRALIKRFVNEKGSLLVRSLVQQRDRAVATAKIAYPFAGLTRKLRERNLSKAQCIASLAASLTVIGTPLFESSWGTMS